MVTCLLYLALLGCLAVGFGACVQTLPAGSGTLSLLGAIVLLVAIDRRLTRKTIIALLLVGVLLSPSLLLAGQPCCTATGCVVAANCECPAGCCAVKQPPKPARVSKVRPRLFKRLLFARRQ